jgi:Cu2+-exporting ATPase
MARAGEGVAADDVHSIAGQGLEGCVDGRRYRIGVAEFAAALSRAALPGSPEAAGTLVLLAGEHGPLAWFEFRDAPREEAAEVIADLRGLGLKVTLLSGDRREEAERVAGVLGIASAHGGMLPQDKLDHLRGLQAEGDVVVMVGDGVNDAPVLAGAQTSLAMGGGTQLAQATADMILLSENLRHIPAGVRVARRTMSIIRQNLAWALGYNLIAVPAAAAGFVPPWLAAIGMSLSSLIVVLNALRLRA